MEKSLSYFNQDKMAANVFLGKYALKDEKGELLEPTPREMHRRLAKEFARIEKRYDNEMTEQEIFDLLDQDQAIDFAVFSCISYSIVDGFVDGANIYFLPIFISRA